jgi:hypothetical protein
MGDLISLIKAYIKPWEEVKNLKGNLIDGLIYNEIGAIILALTFFLFGSLIPSNTLFVGVGSFALIIIVPIGLLVSSLVYYFVAKLLGGKGSYTQQTFVFGALSLPQSLLFAAVIALTAILVPDIVVLATVFLEILILLWSLVLLFFVSKEVHGLTTSKAIIAVLLLVGVGVVIETILVIGLALLYSVGAFNPRHIMLPEICTLPAPFNCIYKNFDATGKLSILLSQSTVDTYTINRIACVDDSLLDANGLPKSDSYWTYINQTIIPGGGITINDINCYTSSGRVYNDTSGSSFTGALIVEYILPSGLRNYTRGSVYARVT